MEGKNNGLSNASLTLGIVSTVCFALFHISIATGILAITFGAKANKQSQYNKGGRTGIITGIIGISLCLGLYITMLVLFLTGVIRI